jgi:hypothetical protein
MDHPDQSENSVNEADLQGLKKLIQLIQEMEKDQSNGQTSAVTSEPEHYVKKEVKDTRTSELKDAQKTEVEAVITPEVLSTAISSVVEKAMEKQNEKMQRQHEQFQEKLDKLSELEEKMVEKLEELTRREEVPKVGYQPPPDSDIDKKLSNIEKLLQERKSNHIDYSYYVDIAKTNISNSFSIFKNFSTEVYRSISTKLVQFVNYVTFGKYYITIQNSEVNNV